MHPYETILFFSAGPFTLRFKMALSTALRVAFVFLVVSTVVVLYQWNFLTNNQNLGIITIENARDRPTNFEFHTDNRGIITIENARDGPVEDFNARDKITTLIQECMTKSNFQPLLKQAQKNALHYYDKFRTIVPYYPLKEYSSHCWVQNYSVHWNSSKICWGALGNITYKTSYCSYFPFPRTIIPYMTKLYPMEGYQSKLVCLPNIFVAGFPKSGSTFFYHFVDNLVSISIKDWGKRAGHKEPQFWVRFFPYEKSSVHTLDVGEMGGYLINFIPGIEKVAEGKDIPLIDGTPNIVMDFPRFSQRENNLTNYCLVPTVLPRLLPDSKYIFVMRNPITMLYSGFWFSFSKNGIGDWAMTLKGPNVFHQQVVSETGEFNMCMRNISEPSISQVCKMEDKDDYASCIRQRLHLLDKCSAKITHHVYSQALPHCGEVRLYTGIYYVHLHKWLHLVERDRMLFYTLEEMKTGAIGVARDVVKTLGLDPSIVTKENVQKATLTAAEHNNKQTLVNYKEDPLLKMREDTAAILEIFYHPFNSLLAELLGHDKFKWF